MGQKHLLLTPVEEVLFIMKPSEINRDARKYYEKGEKYFVSLPYFTHKNI